MSTRATKNGASAQSEAAQAEHADATPQRRPDWWRPRNWRVRSRLVALIVIPPAVALALAATRQMRQEAMNASSLSQLRWLAGATASYAADNQERFWTFSWEAGVLPHSDPTLPSEAATDTGAAAIQATHIIRKLTGRSDFPNQINNVLCFPGMFKGALACRARDINEEMKMAAARAIAAAVPEHSLVPDHIVPGVFDPDVASMVADAVEEAAIRSGVARKGRG